jgi:group I intron endonuclease
MVLLLTAFLEFPAYLSALSIYTDSYIERYKKKLISKMGEQSVVIEYPLIIFFILLRVLLFLLSFYLLLSSDLLYYLVETDFVALLLVPVVTYSNADVHRDQIYQKNRRESPPEVRPGGRAAAQQLYIFGRNKINGKIYIGSAVNLPKRLSHYYSKKSMETYLKRGKSAIYSAILKHGLSLFKLEIIEYCEKKDTIKIEQYYLDLLKPEYNTLKVAGSSLGYKHDDEAKKKISDSQKKIDHSGRFKTGENNPNYGKLITVGSVKPSQKIEVFDLEEKTTTSYNSINEAARALDINPRCITSYFSRNQQKPYKRRYTFNKI